VAIAISFLSVCPRVRKVHGSLIAVTAWTMRILTFGLVNRKVKIDPKKQEVTISKRHLWVYPKRKRIPFDHIAAVTYVYEDAAPFASWSWAHDSFDVFSTGLRLHGGKHVHLFHFFGDGTFRNDGPLPDWMYWEDFLFDTSGTQEQESKRFVNVLSKMIGVEVEPR